MAAPAGLDTVDLALRATEAYGRPDLGGRLTRTRQRLLDPNVRVLVVGEFKQGKSMLVNALVNAPVCPVDDDIATAVPTVVAYAETPSAVVVREPESDGDAGGSHDPAAEPGAEHTPVPVERLAEHVSESGNPANQRRLTYAEVNLPRAILADGLVLVDTPGVGGLGSAQGASTMAALLAADAVLLVSDASQEYTATELEFLQQAMDLCPNVAGVLTKIDLYRHWRRIGQLDRDHLAAAGVEAELLPVSSALRLRAAADDDQELNAEAGFPELVRFLRHRVVGRAGQLARRSASHDVQFVAEQLAASMRAELAVQKDPRRGEELLAELEHTQKRADDLRQRSARWQHTLSDGITDLITDTEHDLRDRMRQIVRDAEHLIDEGDPAAPWEQLTTWLDERVASAVSANFVWACQRADRLARQVGEHFAESGGAMPPELRMGEATDLLGQVQEIERPNLERVGLGQKLITGMRGSYGGVLMFGLLTSVAGMALLNPVSIGAGVLLGGKTVREERTRALQRRQAEAKATVRRHVDEVVFQVNKDTKDRLRGVQRALRDHFTAEAEQLHNSVTESVSAARNAVKTEASERQRRIRDLEAEIERVAALDQHARALAADQGPTS